MKFEKKPPLICKVQHGICHPHFHDGVEIMFLLQGSGRAYCDGIPYLQTPGSILFVPPNAVHSYDNRTEDFFAFLIILDIPSLKNIIDLPKHLTPSNPLYMDLEMKHPVWELIKHAWSKYDKIRRSSSFLYACTIFNELLPLYDFEKSPDRATSLYRIINYCQTNFRESISLSSISEALSLSESRVSHIFSYNLQQSLPDYVNLLRVNEALRLLAHTDKSIAEISSDAGFPSIRTFNRIFKSKFGISPRDYRNDTSLIQITTTG